MPDTPTSTKSFMQIDTLIKIAVYAALGIIAYTNMSNKIEFHTSILQQIKDQQEEADKKWDLRMTTMQTEISTLQIQVSQMKQKQEDYDSHKND